jgi:hypothetical protein
VAWRTAKFANSTEKHTDLGVLALGRLSKLLRLEERMIDRRQQYSSVSSRAGLLLVVNCGGRVSEYGAGPPCEVSVVEAYRKHPTIWPPTIASRSTLQAIATSGLSRLMEHTCLCWLVATLSRAMARFRDAWPSPARPSPDYPCSTSGLTSARGVFGLGVYWCQFALERKIIASRSSEVSGASDWAGSTRFRGSRVRTRLFAGGEWIRKFSSAMPRHHQQRGRPHFGGE